MSDDNGFTGDREFGIESKQLRVDLAELAYPIPSEKLIEEYVDRELELSEGSETLEELIGPLEEDSYSSPLETEQAILQVVGDEAIGRKNYSDRTPYSVGEKRQEEGAPGIDVDSTPESF